MIAMDNQTTETTPNPEMERFDKAVAQMREYLAKNLGGKGAIFLNLEFEGGRIKYLSKQMSEG
jgi:hypothetical protein